MGLPELPEGFTPAFLTEILHADGTLPAGSRVSSISRALVGDGTGMMAELAKLSVSYAGDPGEAPPTFVAKYASQNPTNREIALRYKLYERETRFATELDPLTTTRTPRMYYAGVDDDRFLILMEDMTDYEVGSQIAGATLAQTELALDELAKLHSPFWNQVDDLDWVPGIADSYHAANMKALADIGFDQVMAKFGDYVPDHVPARRDAFLAAILELQAHMNRAPVTLCHGDYRMANLLYGRKPEHDPIAVLDWQGPLRGRGMNDVALFLAQSTRCDVRRQHERSLLERYVAGLEAGGVTGLDWDEVWVDYRRSVLYSWTYVSVVAGTLDSSNATSFNWMAQMVARQCAASDDLDVYELLPSGVV